MISDYDPIKGWPKHFESAPIDESPVQRCSEGCGGWRYQGNPCETCRILDQRGRT